MSFVTVKKGELLSRNIEDYPEGLVIPVDKPYRWTSADVIRKVKWAAIKHFGKRNLKVGHAGTLDPLATGVLLICIGKATKLADEFQKQPKQYIAGVTFGATTASYDLEKEVDTRYPVDGVSRESLLAVLPSFVGEQEQVAPLFSAKSVDGVRVYEMARKRYKAGLPVEGLDVLRASRINIYGLELLDYSAPGGGESSSDPVRDCVAHPSQTGVWAPPSDIAEGGMPLGGGPSAASSRIHVAEAPNNLPKAEILVDCSKGTYIRALARDLGEALGSGAFLHSLRRTRTGSFSAKEALCLDDIMNILNR